MSIQLQLIPTEGVGKTSRGNGNVICACHNMLTGKCRHNINVRVLHFQKHVPCKSFFSKTTLIQQNHLLRSLGPFLWDEHYP